MADAAAVGEANVLMIQVKCHYLGSAPVKSTTERVAQEALGLLQSKLQSLQAKKIDMFVEKQYGSRLSSASPVYKKAAEKLAKSGHDLTLGDPVDLQIDVQHVNMIDHVRRNFTQLVVESVTFQGILATNPDGSQIVCFIRTDGGHHNCHALRASPAVAQQIFQCLTNVTKGAKQMRALEENTKRAGVGLSVVKDAADNTITLNVGTARRSSFKVAGDMRRLGSINLKGKRTGEIKRSSNSYGASFSAMAPEASTAAPPPTTSAVSRKSSTASSQPDDDLDDDMLNEIDDSLFGEVQIVDDTTSFSGFGNLTDFDLGNFGFDGDDAAADDPLPTASNVATTTAANDDLEGFGFD